MNKTHTPLICAFVISFLLTLSASADTNILQPSGNVGVGTTTPSSALQVMGKFKIGDGHENMGSISNIERSIHFYSKGANANVPNIAHTGGRIYSTNVEADLHTGIISGWPAQALVMEAGCDWETGAASDFGFRKWQMVLLGNGNIGINTALPDALLTVQGDGSAPLALNVGGSSNGKMRVRHIDGKSPSSTEIDALYLQWQTDFPTIINGSGGYVGIGTDNPTHKLTVNGAIRANQIIINNTNSQTIPTDALLTIEGDGSAPLALNVGGDSNGRLRVRHIEGKSSVSTESDNLYLQYGVNSNTYINSGPSTGNVCIGTGDATYKLNVGGAIRAKEIIVDSGWADYVFDDNYPLQSLDVVEQHIKEKKHLPGIPSAKEIGTQGVSLGDMQSLLLAKIEELTLHQIAQEKRLKALEVENTALRALICTEKFDTNRN